MEYVWIVFHCITNTNAFAPDDAASKMYLSVEFHCIDMYKITTQKTEEYNNKLHRAYRIFYRRDIHIFLRTTFS